MRIKNNYILIILALAFPIMILQSFYAESNKYTVTESVKTKEIEDKTIILFKQADQLFLEGKRIIEEACNGTDIERGFEILNQSASLFNQLGYFKGESDVLKYQADVMNKIGLIHYKEGKLSSALELFNQSLYIYIKINQPQKIGEALINIGNIYFDLGQYEKALDNFKEALDIYKRENDAKWEGDALLSIGNVELNLARYSDAIKKYKKARKKYKKIDYEQGISNANTNIGNAYFYQGKHKNALKQYKEALKIHKKIMDKKGEGADYTNIAVIYGNLVQYSKALEYYDRALKIYKEIIDKEGESASYTNIGNIYINLGEYSRAFEYYEKALKIHKKIMDKKGEGIDYTNIAVVHTYLAQYTEALSKYDDAKKIFRKIDDKNGEANCLMNEAIVHLNQNEIEKDPNEIEKAEKKLNEALAIYKKINVCTDLVEENLADIYVEKGDPINIEKAGKLYDKIDNKIGKARIHLLKKEYTKSIESYEKSLYMGIKTKNIDMIYASNVGLGLSYELLHKYKCEDIKNCQIAKEYYLKAVELIEELRESLFPNQKTNFFDIKIYGFSRLDPYEGLIRVLYRLHEYELSFFYAEHSKARCFQESISGIHKDLLFNLPNESALLKKDKDLELQIATLYQRKDKAFRENRIEAYDYNDKELKKKKKEQKKFISQELRKKYLEYATIKYPQPLKASEIPLKSNEYLLEFEVTDKETFAWLVNDKKIIKTKRILKSRDELKDLIEKYHDLFMVTNETIYKKLNNFNPQPGYELYKILLEDMLSSVPENAHIIIVPDEKLCILPFEALVMDIAENYCIIRRGIPYGLHYVADNYSISYYQSATSLANIRNLHKKTQVKRALFVLTDPVFNREEDERFKSVSKDKEIHNKKARIVREEKKYSQVINPYAFYLKSVQEGLRLATESEVLERLKYTNSLAALIELFDGKKEEDLLEGFDAIYSRFIEKPLQDYLYILFASHGILEYSRKEGIPEPALILTLYDEEENILPPKESYLPMSKIMNLRFNAKCIFLLACQTGRGKDLHGEGVMSMGRAFQYAGAKSVVTSLWSVPEKSSVLLAKQFFEHVRNEKSIIEAMRAARDDIRNISKYSHPFFWASFIVIGETN